MDTGGEIYTKSRAQQAERYKGNLGRDRMVQRESKEPCYPPDKQDKAVQTVLEQAETLCEHWAA